MIRGWAASMGGIALVLAIASAQAGDLLVQGRVLRVVPVDGRSEIVEHSDGCEREKPVDGGLVDLLGWDLGAGCRTSTRRVGMVKAYRVYYEWNGRVYETVMTRRPAASIPLKVRVHPSPARATP